MKMIRTLMAALALLCAPHTPALASDAAGLAAYKATSPVQRTRERLARSIARAGGRLPSVNTSGFTVGYGADGVSALTGATTYDALTYPQLFTLMRGRWGAATQNFPGTLNVTGKSVTPIAASSAQAPGGNALVRFWSSAPDLEIVSNSGQSGYRLKIDGSYAVQGVIADRGGNGDFRYNRVKWGDGSASNRRLRLYEVEFYSDGWFYGVRQSAAEVLAPAPVADSLRVIVHGDSFVGGSGMTTNGALMGSMASGIGALLGQVDTWNSGVGSSGFLAHPNSGVTGTPVTTFLERVQPDVVAFAPDVVIEMGGINDGSLATADPAGFQSAVQSWLSQIITAKPGTLIFMTGPMSPNSGLNTNAINVLVRDRKAAACARFAANCVFIDNLAAAWVTGTGKVGSPTGTGPSDWITGSDGTHPTDDGMLLLERRVVDAIADRLPLQ
jgi:lysophospholipase L1-like esterase